MHIAPLREFTPERVPALERAPVPEREPVPTRISRRDDGDARRNEEHPLAAAVSGAFARLGLAPRIRVLAHLIQPIGPLALAVLGKGVFAKYARAESWSGMPLTVAEAARVTPEHVYELVRYLEQSDPRFLRRVIVDLACDAESMASLGVPAKGPRARRRPRRGAACATLPTRKFLLARELDPSPAISSALPGR